MAADHTLDQALMRQVIKTAVPAVALPGGIDQRQIARLIVAVRRIAFLGELLLLQCQRDFLGEPDSDKSTCGDGVAVANKAHGFRGRDDLAFVRVA
jgi:hypothetical protein